MRLIVGFALALLAGLVPTTAAAAKSPTGDFTVFSQCPRFTPDVNLCIYSQITSGEVRIGRTVVPITKTLTLQGGIIRDETETETFVGASDGESLLKTPLLIPGGLGGIMAAGSLPKSLQARLEAIQRGTSNVTATIELVGLPEIDRRNLVLEEGIVLSLPARIKLDNAFLGRECLIASHANPLTIDLTSGRTSPPGPNMPIRGSVGPFIFKDEFEFVAIKPNLLVDNSFSVPAASGCGGSYASLVDPLIDAKIGLPSAAGRNTAIQQIALAEATTVGVIASEK